MELCQTLHTKRPSMQLLWAHCLLLALGFDFSYLSHVYPCLLIFVLQISTPVEMQGEGSSSCSLSELQAYSFAAGEGDSHCDIVVGGCLLVKLKQSSVRWALQSRICTYMYVYVTCMYMVELYVIVVDIDNLFRFTCPSYRQLAFRENFQDVAHVLLMYQKVHSQHLAAWKYAWWDPFVGHKTFHSLC